MTATSTPAPEVFQCTKPSKLNTVYLPTSKILDLLKDRKDRTTKRYYDHETALFNDAKIAGIRNPIKVIPEGEDFRTVSGQTRLNVGRRLGLPTMPATILEGEMTLSRLLIEELADNNSTESFDILALAELFHDIMRENKWKTQVELCRNVPLAKPATVCKALSIFENLLEELKPELRTGNLKERPGYQLSRHPKEKQMELFKAIAGMSVEGAEEYLRDKLDNKKKVRQRPVRLRTPHGITIAIPGGMDPETALADLAIPPEAIKKAKKEGLPLAMVGMLIRNQPTV